MMINSLAIDNSYWVIPERFKAGEYPGSIQNDETRSKLRWLFAQGIYYFLDLTAPGEYDLKPYVDLLNEEANKIHKTVVHKRFPIRDLSNPSREEMMEILNTIDLALAAGNNIYLHCFGGKGRTGTVVGCYLAQHGLLGAEALEKIREMRKGLPDGERPSPETEAQIGMVKEWMKV